MDRRGSIADPVAFVFRSLLTFAREPDNCAMAEAMARAIGNIDLFHQHHVFDGTRRSNSSHAEDLGYGGLCADRVANCPNRLCVPDVPLGLRFRSTCRPFRLRSSAGNPIRGLSSSTAEWLPSDNRFPGMRRLRRLTGFRTTVILKV